MTDLLLDAYRRTTYRARTPRGELALRIGEPAPELDRLLIEHGVTTWAYVTACNPQSRRLPEEENRRRTEQLRQALTERGLRFFEGQSESDDGNWLAEVRLLVLGLSREAAIAIVNPFDQRAIVCGARGGVPELVEIR